MRVAVCEDSPKSSVDVLHCALARWQVVWELFLSPQLWDCPKQELWLQLFGYSCVFHRGTRVLAPEQMRHMAGESCAALLPSPPLGKPFTAEHKQLRALQS